MQPQVQASVSKSNTNLRLELLGTPIVLIGQTSVKLGVKPLAMLAIAALRGRVSRRELGTILWADAANPLNNLSVARNALEKTLGKNILSSDLEHFNLEPGFSCDVLEFRAGVNTQDVKVWDLWRGGFLTGLRLTDWEMGLGEEFEEWLYATREALIFERREFAARLGITQLRLGNYQTALPFLEVSQSPDGDPLEDACRHLMLTYGATHQADRAVVAFNNLGKVLQEELGVQPSNRTKAALELVRSAQASDCQNALQLELGVTVVALPEVVDAPLVGRETELQAILDFLKTGQVVVIQGEPGAGKSRLALEVCRHIEARFQGSSLWVRCNLDSLNYGVLESLVRQHFKQFPNTPLTLNATEKVALASLVPDLIQAEFSGGFERLMLFNTVKNLLPNTALTTLVIDNAQWMDAASGEFLKFLLERCGQGLQLILTQRNNETLNYDLELAFKNKPVKQITLAALSEGAISELAERLQANGVDIPALVKRSGGNAFFVLELLRFASDTESRVQDKVRLRLKGLSETAHQVLEALCIRHQLATFGTLRSISGRSLEELGSALEELQGAVLIGIVGDQIGFVHDIVREVIESDLSPSRRSLLHYRAAQIRDQFSARHYWEARNLLDQKDQRDAHQAFLEFSRNHAQRGDLSQALEWLERSLNTANSPEARAEVFLETANILESFGRHQEALEELETAASIAASLEPVLKARLLNTRALILLREYRNFKDSKTTLDAALEILVNQVTPNAQDTMGETYYLLGSFEEHQKNYLPALEYFKKARRIRRATGNQGGLADSLGGLGLVYLALNEAKAETYLLDCLNIREALGDVGGVARVLTNIGMFYGQQNQLEKALVFQKRSLNLQQQLENPTGIAIALNNLGVTAFELGQYQTALLHYQNAIRTLENNQLPVREDFRDNLNEVTAKLESPR